MNSKGIKGKVKGSPPAPPPKPKHLTLNKRTDNKRKLINIPCIHLFVYTLHVKKSLFEMENEERECSLFQVCFMIVSC